MNPEDEARDSVVRHPEVEDLGRGAHEQDRINAFAGDLAAWLVGAPRDTLGALSRVVITVAGRDLRDARAVAAGIPLLAVEGAARATATMWPLLRDPEQETPAAQFERERALKRERGEHIGGTANLGAGVGESGGAGAGGEYDPEKDEGQAAGIGEALPKGGDGGTTQGEGKGMTPMFPDLGPNNPGGAGQLDAQPEAIDPRDVIRMLADGELPDDPELDALAGMLRPTYDLITDPVQAGKEIADQLASVGESAFNGCYEGESVCRTLELLVPGLGWGTSVAALHRSMLGQLGALSELLGKLNELKAIARALGRMEAADRNAGTERGGSEEVVGVHFGGEVADALPCELGLLGDPDTEDLFYQRMLERRLVSLELAGAGIGGVADRDRRGPVIACIDTSGSMRGAPEAVAKALVLAICKRVIPQGRVVHLVLFGGPGQLSELRLRRGLGGLAGLLDFLAMTFSSGTDFDAPLRRAVELLGESEMERADLMLVTDGLGHAATDVVALIDEARAVSGLRVWTVLLGKWQDDEVRVFSDRVWQLDAGDGVAVGLVERITRPEA